MPLRVWWGYSVGYVAKTVTDPKWENDYWWMVQLVKGWVNTVHLFLISLHASVFSH